MSSRVDQDSRRGDGEEGISQVIRESEGEPGRRDPGLDRNNLGSLIFNSNKSFQNCKFVI